jgi:hypothetical protein
MVGVVVWGMGCGGCGGVWYVVLWVVWGVWWCGLWVCRGVGGVGCDGCGGLVGAYTMVYTLGCIAKIYATCFAKNYDKS